MKQYNNKIVKSIYETREFEHLNYTYRVVFTDDTYIDFMATGYGYAEPYYELGELWKRYLFILKKTMIIFKWVSLKLGFGSVKFQWKYYFIDLFNKINLKKEN